MRDPIPGSDWRNDGGWAIVLERGAHTVTRYWLTADSYHPAANINNWRIDDPANGVEQIRLAGHNGGFAFRRYLPGNRIFTPDEIIFDLNEDGELTSADTLVVSGNIYYRTGTFSSWPEAYGTSYIRWANMAWCR